MVLVFNPVLSHELGGYLRCIRMNVGYDYFFFSADVHVYFESLLIWRPWSSRGGRRWRGRLARSRFLRICVWLESVFFGVAVEFDIISCEITDGIFVFPLRLTIQVVPLISILGLFLSMSSSPWSLSVF